MNRRLCVLLATLACVCLAPAAGTTGETAMYVDLSKVANMGFLDETADDGKGGWTDQGGNDFRNMPVGD